MTNQESKLEGKGEEGKSIFFIFTFFFFNFLFLYFFNFGFGGAAEGRGSTRGSRDGREHRKVNARVRWGGFLGKPVGTTFKRVGQHYGKKKKRKKIIKKKGVGPAQWWKRVVLLRGPCSRGAGPSNFFFFYLLCHVMVWWEGPGCTWVFDGPNGGPGPGACGGPHLPRPYTRLCWFGGPSQMGGGVNGHVSVCELVGSAGLIVDTWSHQIRLASMLLWKA